MTTPTTPPEVPLAGSGPSATQEDWEAAAAAVLRKSRALAEDAPDADVWTALAHTTLDGVVVPPLGTASSLDGLVTSGRPQRVGPWDNRSWLIGGESSVDALAELEGGATSLFLEVVDSDLARSLSGVLYDVAPVTLNRPTPRVAGEFADLLASYDGKPLATNNLSADLETGLGLPHRTEEAWTEESFVSTVRRAQDLGVLGAVVDGTFLHDRGATDAQELGWTMAVGVRYLRLLVAAGFEVSDAASLIEFRYAATDEQFPTIAKLRAARRLWARVLDASGAEPVAQRQHVITSRAMMTKFDPWTNMLRTTVAAFGACVAGADAVTVLPFDTFLGSPDAFGRRIARNTSSLLIDESHVGAVSDPAGGAYAIERFTDDLAIAGWAEFQTIEREGGSSSDAARSGVRDRVREAASRRDAAIANRSRPITGVSEFPNLAETLPARPGSTPLARRYASRFEDLRERPAEQPVFLATMGTVAEHTARATFATNLFAAGGVSVESAGATDGVSAVLAGYSGQPVVCLAGTDAAYADWGADLISGLRAAGASYVILAGKPGERTVTGVDDSCAMGVEALDFLGRVRAELGVKEES